MSGAGAVGALWGLKVGREALTGVTQPEARPTSNPLGIQESGQNLKSAGNPTPFLQESEIVERVKQQMEGNFNSN